MKNISLTPRHTYRLRTALKFRKVLFDIPHFNEEDFSYLFNFNNNQSAASHNDRYWYKRIDSKFVLTDLSDDKLVDCVPDTVMSNLFDLNREIAKRGNLKGYAKISEKRLDELLVDSQIDQQLQGVFDAAFDYHKGLKQVNYNWQKQDSNNKEYDTVLQEQIEILLIDLATIIVMPILGARLSYNAVNGTELSIKALKVLGELFKLIDDNKTLILAMSIIEQIEGAYNYTKKCVRECLDLANWYADDLDMILSKKKSYKTFTDLEFKKLYQELKAQHFAKPEVIGIQE